MSKTRKCQVFLSTSVAPCKTNLTQIFKTRHLRTIIFSQIKKLFRWSKLFHTKQFIFRYFGGKESPRSSKSQWILSLFPNSNDILARDCFLRMFQLWTGWLEKYRKYHMTTGWNSYTCIPWNTHSSGKGK